ncbi:hypothetical protein PPERSA_00557 [Pseudocohnilembus persalinus]|uniref:Bystin n=1 Tax=Pseudocohnilembus persalinus TaxID=266149 RepID=A0A0V0QTK0_PSEPJ|nr:hypothetical protein PPERSA_00557 [Pseudocohnilembus persalinus]|eukprot:KRX05256.1 hypothetical protein PPERSA_00557 [Pseudocohnilembus persalinus]
MGTQKTAQKGKPSQNKKKIISKSSNKLKKYDKKDNEMVKLRTNQDGGLVQEKRKGENNLKSERFSKDKILNKKQRLQKEGENDVVEHFDQEGFFVLPQNLQISQQDEDILNQFSLGNLASQVAAQFQEEVEINKQQQYKENILSNPKIKVVYSDIAELLKTYRSGKLARAFKIIPNIEQWQEVLELTKPEQWTPQAMNAATKCFASNLDPYRARIFFEKYLVPAIRKDIQKHKKLNCHYYFALQKALYKPAAWFKGILFPILISNDCTLKEAQILGSVLQKMSIPAIHASVAILKLSQFNYTGPIGIIQRVLIEKKYALPVRVIQSLIDSFMKFQNDERNMPVIWHQYLLRFVQLYNNSQGMALE